MKAVEALAQPLYQPIDTPEFAHCSSQQPCVERYEMIRPHLAGVTTVLDVGCHTGWFCRQMRRDGIVASGIDRSQEWIAAAKELDPEGCYSVERIEHLRIAKVDAALCLSVAMYFENCFDVLAKISAAAPKMFFDFGGQYAGSLPFTEEDAIPAILGHTQYTEGIFIGRSAIHRPLYLFTR